MVKNAILIHGTGGSPNSNWFQYIDDYLTSKGYEVFRPQLPNKDRPNIENQVPFLLESSFEFNEETIIIAHSAGCPITIALLEELETKVDKVILVGGYLRSLDIDITKPTLKKEEEYNWEKIRNSVNHFYILNSDDDPFGCTIENQGKYMAEKLGGELISMIGEKHMCVIDDPIKYRQLPILKELVDR